jgi:adenylate cyclase
MNFNNYVGLGSAHEVAQEYDEAGFYRRALEERPTAGWIYRNVAFVSVGGRLSRRG